MTHLNSRRPLGGSAFRFPGWGYLPQIFPCACLLVLTFVFRLCSSADTLVSGDSIRVPVAHSFYLFDRCAVEMTCSVCAGVRSCPACIRTSHALHLAVFLGNHYLLPDLDLSAASSRNLLNFAPISISHKPLANFPLTAFSLRIPVLPGMTLSWQLA